jgi:anti-sigma regulatory factor (Ser/Thr protein kinase)
MEEEKVSLNLVIPRSFDELDMVREAFVNFLRHHKIDEGAITHLELSVYEAVVNIIEHTSPKYKKQKITIQCDITSEEVIVSIMNVGDKFDTTKVALPDIDYHYKKGRMRGLGIYFIMKLMDEVEYSYKKNVNILKFIKKIKEEKN